jgi:hypothetical protein
MCTISLKLEQTKKSKNGNSLISLSTKQFQFNDNEEATKICLSFIESIGQSLNLAREMGANGVKIGNVNFSFNSKFLLYVNIDGLDYSLDDVPSIWEGTNKTENSFKNSKAFFVSIYQIIRTSQGKSALLTQDANKQATKLLSI